MPGRAPVSASRGGEKGRKRKVPRTSEALVEDKNESWDREQCGRLLAPCDSRVTSAMTRPHDGARGTSLWISPARAERSAPRTIDQEVFENESPIAAMERPAAFTADQLLVCGYRFGFDAHNLVLRAAGRTFERARTGGGHATPLIEWLRDRSNRRLRQLSLSQDQRVRASGN